MRLRWWVILGIAGMLSLALGAFADGAGDNSASNVRHIPPPGIAVPAADRTELEAGTAQLG